MASRFDWRIHLTPYLSWSLVDFNLLQKLFDQACLWHLLMSSTFTHLRACRCKLSCSSSFSMPFGDVSQPGACEWTPSALFAPSLAPNESWRPPVFALRSAFRHWWCRHWPMSPWPPRGSASAWVHALSSASLVRVSAYFPHHLRRVGLPKKRKA